MVISKSSTNRSSAKRSCTKQNRGSAATLLTLQAAGTPWPLPHKNGTHATTALPARHCPPPRRPPYARPRARLRDHRAGIFLEHLGHALRTGILQQIRRPLFTNNKINASEAWSRGYSWGLMQVMGQVARENGFTPVEHPFLAELCDPEQGIAVGCRVLLRKFTQAARDFRYATPSVYTKSSAPGAPSRPPASSPGTPSSSNASSSSSQSPSAPATPVPAPSNSAISLATPTDLALITRALALWNGGANPDYPRQVLSHLPHYA